MDHHRTLGYGQGWKIGVVLFHPRLNALIGQSLYLDNFASYSTRTCRVERVISRKDVIKLCLQQYQSAYVIQLYRAQQKCAPACWNAEGFHCECSCMGENHGGGHPGGNWHEVSETFAVSWGDQRYSCRHLKTTALK